MELLDLPEGTQLAFDPGTHVALLLDAGAPLRAAVLSGQAAGLLLALLDAYPDHCTHRRIFARLSPMEAFDRSIARRPIRRAVQQARRALRPLGLTVIALRHQGYVLAADDAKPISLLPRIEAQEK